MKHIHADNMLLYAQDAQETDKPWERWEWRWSSSTSGHWVKAEASDIEWDLEIDYRRIDPYRELKEAQMRGKTIQVQTTDHGTCWGDRCYPCCIYWDLPPDRYRVKPEADPYKHLREAQERGEVIQERDLLFKTQWIEYESSEFPREPNRYRIKPEEAVYSKTMHIVENGGAWTGTIGGKDVTFVIHGNITGVELFDKCLNDDEIRKTFDAKTVKKWRWKAHLNGILFTTTGYFTEEGINRGNPINISRIDSTMIEVEA